MSRIEVRAARPGDGEAIGRLSEESAAYYRELAPDDFRLPDAELRIRLVARGRERLFDPRLEAAQDLATELRHERQLSLPVRFWEGRGYRTRAVIMRKRLD